MKNRPTPHAHWERSPVKRRLQVNDPYRPGKAGPRGVCPECGLLYRDKRWALERRAGERPGEPPIARVLCPACRKIRDRVFFGEVLLSGPFIASHRGEVEAVVLHEEARAMAKNPLERIIDSRWEGGSLVIHTTVRKLAQRIGRAVHGSFKGTLALRPADGGTITRVSWKR